ncbi:MAG: di-trans,poly-cis-decaprenylcistransferase [Thermoplasmata archaeon]|nr:MAG: di-trans,poly-cis-decaprenylcistransferase [Thermoplasmata archaeon]
MTDLPSLIAETAYRAMVSRLRKEVLKGRIPRHVAVIMDGNRRWAREMGLNKKDGYSRGFETFMNLVDWSKNLGIKYLTAFALSTENLHRRKEELEIIFSVIRWALSRVEKDRPWERGIRLNVIGKLELLPQDIRERINRVVELSSGAREMVVTAAIAYGGRMEIIEAIRRIASDVKRGVLEPEEIDENLFSRYLMTHELPDPDLILRTSGEERISNFLLWQSAYSELFFTDVYWPNFSELDFLRAIRAYQLRERRFGR